MGDMLYGQDFYDSQIYGSLQSAQVYLYQLFSVWGVPGAVADLGCGRGAWLATCRDLGVKRCVGIDGDWNSQADMLDPNIEFHPADLEKSISLTESFDLAISLEVAEHLKPESSDAFVESLSGLSGAILFGAAFIGQPGVNHINNRLHSFWAEKFFARGYLLCDFFRPSFWSDDRVEPCYRQNTFLYVKPGHSLHSALVSRGYVCNQDVRFIDCVHPAIYLGLLKEFIKLEQTAGAGRQELSLRGLDASEDTGAGLPDKRDNLDVLFEQAKAQLALNQFHDAADTYRQALALEPNNPEGLLRLSHLLLQAKCYEECFHHARHFLRLVQDLPIGYYLAGHAARELGRWQESRLLLLRAVELDPGHIFARVLCCMSSFTVCMNQAETASMMRTYAAELEELIRNTGLDTAEQINDAVVGIGALTPFFLPYLGGNVKDLQVKYGSWICSIMAAKFPQFTDPLPQRSSTGKIKIGIVSNYFYNHSNWKIPIKGWLEQLDRRLFSIHSVYTDEISDQATEQARSLSDSFLQSCDTDALAAGIYDQNFDVLIYPGIGMDAATLKLAALRLAPVQCASWGHPVTTGMPTVDYYISSDLMEPENGDERYSEKLVRLPNLSIWYEPSGRTFDESSNLVIPGLEEDDVMFLCSQNLLKYLPQYDFIFPAIAGQVINARFVFISSYVQELTDKFLQRIYLAFQQRGLDAAKYVSMAPQLNEADFSALNARTDIFLDSIEWSGCNTVFESLPFNKPVVTMPGAFMRGRHAYAILKMMGIKETIAANVEEYIAIAVRLANDKQWLDKISARVSCNKHKIYRDRESMEGLETFLIKISGRSSGEGYSETLR
ncbi:MAG: methyltransferase domain-containing protein [Geobacter sp.]|nr:methyltransferase domain-containing protein [Geobacter sp.]